MAYVNALGTADISGFRLMRVAGGFRRILQTELGQEQLCARCNESWPMDREFYRISGLCVSYECKACMQERKGK